MRKNEYPVLVLFGFFVANESLPMLAVADLKKSFLSPEGARVEIVNVRAFTLAAGEQLALRGESGSGKTTFLNLIAGILAADSGRVAIDPPSAKPRGFRKRRSSISSPHSSNVLPTTRQFAAPT